MKVSSTTQCQQLSRVPTGSLVTLVAISHTGCIAYASTHCTLWPWWLHHTLAVQPTYPHTAPWVCPPRHTQLWRSRTQRPVRGHQPHLWNQSHCELRTSSSCKVHHLQYNIQHHMYVCYGMLTVSQVHRLPPHPTYRLEWSIYTLAGRFSWGFFCIMFEGKRKTCYMK